MSLQAIRMKTGVMKVSKNDECMKTYYSHVAQIKKNTFSNYNNLLYIEMKTKCHGKKHTIIHKQFSLQAHECCA